MLRPWKKNKKSERGVALLVALFALILITAVGLGLIFSSNSEFSVNNSFRQNHLAFFAARSGLEEARDRMRYASTDSTTPAGMGISDRLTLPAPGLNSLGQTNSALYIVNGSGIDPTNFSSSSSNSNGIYFDDELCHEINSSLIANSPGSFNIKCPHTAGSLPTAANWATKIAAEPVPSNGGAISYAWTRINLKLQESTNPWCVLGLGLCTPQTGTDAVADQVCYDGTREFVLADAMPMRDAPGGLGGLSLRSSLAMGMYFDANGKGTSGHSSTTGSSTSSSSSSGSSTGGTSGGGTSGGGTGNGGACSGLFTPPPPPAAISASSCTNANGQPVYTVTSLAFTPGGARRMLQYEIARITIPPVPAALTMAGPNPIFGTPNSNPFGISGVNPTSCTGAGNVGSAVPAIGTTTDVAAPGDSSATQTASNAATTIANSLAKPANFTGAGCSAGGDVQNVIDVAPTFNTPAGLNALVQSVIGSANVVTSNASTVSNWGTDASPQVIAITGDATVSSGAGILLVTGNVTMNGNFSWDGLILVIGKGSLTAGNGGGNGQINGSVVIANIEDSHKTPDYATSPSDSNYASTLGSPTFNWNGGGTNFIQYNSCTMTTASQHAIYKVLARREIVY